MHVLNLHLANKAAPWQHLAARAYHFSSCTESANAFRANIERVNGLLMLPGYAFMSGGEWQVAVKTVAERYFGNDMPSDKEFAEKREEMATLANAARKNALSKRSPESAINTFYTACHNIEVFANDFPRLHEWLHDIFKSALIQSWTAFEVLAEDLWRGSITECPSLEAPLTKKEEREMGFRSRRKIRLAYQSTFKHDAAAIRSALEPFSIDVLAVVRNVIVHSSGNVDDFFKKDSAGLSELNHLRVFPTGTAIPFDGEFVRSIIDRAFPCGYALLKAVDEWLLANR
jgi:hypothetical protein